MKNCFKSIKLLIKTYPSFLFEEILSCALGILQSIIPIYVVRDIVKYYEDGKSIKEIIIYVLIIFLIMAVIGCVQYLLELLKMNISRLFNAKVSEVFYSKLSEIDYDFHENPAFLNDYTRALEEGVDNIYSVANNTFQTAKIIIRSISVFAIIATLDYITILIAFGVGILYILVFIRIGFINKKQRSLTRPYQRFSWYSNRAFTIKDGMADIKTSQIDKILIENNENALSNIVKISDKYTTKSAAWGFLAELLLAFLYPITVAILAYIMTDISNNLALFSSLTVAASTLSSLIASLASSIGSIEDTLPDVRVPFDLLKMKGLIEGNQGIPFDEDFESLEVKNMTFSYTGDKNQLEDVNMQIKKGEKIAIIGANGAGKTTLVKLLLRLYDPNSGELLINNKKYTDLNVKGIRKIVGAVFQNVEVYAVTIAENILLRKPETEEDYKLIDESLKFSGLYDYVYSLRENINTEVSREFHGQGAIFSGGQNQRLAIARGYAQNYQLFVLDEPSSALDPLAEAQVYKNMLEIGKNKTIIFISHRLTTTVNSDKIYLFEKGRVIESGSHDELMALKGVYYKMFVSQSSKYVGKDYE